MHDAWGTRNVVLFVAFLGMLALGIQMHVVADQEDRADESRDMLGPDRPDLDQDADIEPLLRNARRYADDGRYRDAARLIQRTVDNAYERRSLLVRGDHSWVQIRHAVENLLRTMDDQLLSQYQSLVEGEARRLLSQATGENEETALGELQGRFFLSRHGDEAAFRLGVIYLDRYEFPQARAQFKRALEHPTPGVEPEAIHKRLAAIAAFQGDTDELASQMDALAGYDGLDDAMAESLEALVGRERRREEAVALDDWPMHFGTPRRHGHQPALPDGAFESDQLWTTMWASDKEMFGVKSPAADMQGPARGMRVQSTTRTEMLKRWRAHGWTPSSRLHFADGLVLFKTHHYINPHRPDQPPLPALVALDMESGELQWAADVVAPRSLTDSASASRARIIHHGRQQGTEQPTFLEEILLFGDRIAQELTIDGGVVYTVEGHEWLAGTGGRVGGGWGMGRQVSHMGGNNLAAIDLRTGKRLWRITGDRGGDSDDLLFMAAPIEVGGRLFAPVRTNDVLYLAAIDPSPDHRGPGGDGEGRILWKTFLCSTTHNESKEWSPVGMARAGSDIYVATGRGLVFAVSAVDGAIRWANEYEQSGDDPPRGRVSHPGMQTLEGWDEDVVFPLGSLLVVLPSDARRIVVLDRETGKWLDGSLDLRRDGPLDYMLGVTEDGIVAVGDGKVRRYRITADRTRERWARSISGMTGRGILAGDEVYIPGDDRIHRLRVDSGEPAGELKVDLNDEDGPVVDPLGNIYSTGENLLATGMGRIYVMGDAQHRLDTLNDMIAEGGADMADWLESRARILERMGRLDAAAADLRKVIEKITADSRTREVEGRLLEVLLEAARQDVDQAGRLLDEADELAREAAQKARVGLEQARHAHEQDRIDEAFDLYIDAATHGGTTLVRAEPGQRMSRQSVTTVATRRIESLLEEHDHLKQDFVEKGQQRFEAALEEGGDIEQLLGLGVVFAGGDGGRRAVMLAADRLFDEGRLEEAEQVLRELMRHGDEVSRLTGKAALAKLYERAGWKRAAGRLWKELETRGDGEVELPWGNDGHREVTELATERLDALGADADGEAPGISKGTWEQQWHEGGVRMTSHLLDVGLDGRTDHLDRLILMPSMQANPAIIGRMSGEDTRWQLDLPDSRISGTRVLNQNMVLLNGFHLSTSDGALLRDGHVGFAVGHERVMAFGLVNRGDRRDDPLLWDVELEGELAIDQARPGQPVRIQQGLDPYAVGSGVVAVAVSDAITAEQGVRVYCSRTGALKWEKAVSEGSVEGVGVSGDYVVVIDENDRGRIHDRRSGEQVGELRMENRTSGRPVLWTEHGLVYVSSNNRVNLIELPSGKLAWRFDAGGRAMQMRLQDPDMLVVVSQNPHGVTVADMSNGKREWAVEADDLGRDFRRGISDAAIADDGSLVITGPDDDHSPQVVFIDADKRSRPEEGKVVIGTTGGRVQFGNQMRATWFAGPSAVVPRLHVTDQNRRTGEVRFSRRDNGEDLDDQRLDGPQDGRVNTMTGPVAIVGDTVLVSHQNGMRAFRPKQD